MFDSIIFGGIALIGIVYWLWSINKDLKQYKSTKNSRLLIGTILGIVFIGLILVMNWKNNSDLNKPTLVRVYYDGDFNGTSIDFKTDGTYIFDNSAIGLSDYVYGKYEINGNRIILDKNNLDNVVMTNQLEIRPKTIEYSDRKEVENYVYQIDKKGNVLKNETEFRIVVDNHK